MQVNASVGQTVDPAMGLLPRLTTRSTVLGALLALGLSWWLFGITVVRLGSGTVVLQRVLGRVTRIYFLDPTFRETERLLYPWSEPYEQGDPMTFCASLVPERWLDANHDGRWDTWLLKLGPDASGECGLEFRVDTMLKGQPDWVFTRRGQEVQKAWAVIEARRGF